MVYKKIIFYIIGVILILSLIIKFFQATTNNFIIKEDKNFKNSTFINNIKGCGKKENENGIRKNKSIVVIENSKDIFVTNGTFSCTNKSIFYVDNSKNLIISNINASKGSDNVLQVDNSFSIIKDSTISFNENNKCIEGDNGIIILSNNIIKNCTIGLEIEKNDNSNYTAIVLLNNEFKDIKQNIIRCFDNKEAGQGKIYLFTKNNRLNKTPYFGTKHPCLNKIDINKNLEDAILNNNFQKIQILIEELIFDFKKI